MQVRQRMDVERLVNWALAEQGLGWASDRPTLGFADYGTRIDSGGAIASPSISLLDDDDAPLVRAAIDELAGESRVLVFQYGRSGLRPEGAEAPLPELQQLRGKSGQLMWERQRPGDRKSPVTGPMLDWASYEREKAMVLEDRARWSSWWEGLRALVAPLNNRLATHCCTGPEAPREPWTIPRPTVFGPDGTPLAEPVRPPKPLDLVSEEEARWRARSPDVVRAELGRSFAPASDWSRPVRVAGHGAGVNRDSAVDNHGRG